MNKKQIPSNHHCVSTVNYIYIYIYICSEQLKHHNDYLVFVSYSCEFESDWHVNILKSSSCCLQQECETVQEVVSKFLREKSESWSCFLHWQCPTVCCLLHSRQDLKQINWMREINDLKWRQFALRNLHVSVAIKKILVFIRLCLHQVLSKYNDY